MPVLKASDPKLQYILEDYHRQLNQLNMQLCQHQLRLKEVTLTKEFPYLQAQYRRMLENVQRQQRLCERMKRL